MKHTDRERERERERSRDRFQSVTFSFGSALALSIPPRPLALMTASQLPPPASRPKEREGDQQVHRQGFRDQALRGEGGGGRSARPRGTCGGPLDSSTPRGTCGGGAPGPCGLLRWQLGCLWRRHASSQARRPGPGLPCPPGGPLRRRDGDASRPGRRRRSSGPLCDFGPSGSRRAGPACGLFRCSGHGLGRL